MEQKEVLRKRLKAQEHTKDAAASAQILEELLQILKNSGARSVLLYRAVKMWHEIDVSSLPDLLPDIHFEVVESTKNTPFPERKFDVVVIPLLGFNKNGYRLGHGGGWYDKFLLTQPRALKIGVGREDTLVDFEVEVHDVRMNSILTEKRVRDFRDGE